MKQFRWSAILLMLWLGLPLSGYAQIDFCQTGKAGSLSVSADSAFYQLIDSTLRANKQARKIKGYRIQIYFGSERREASRVKTRFLKKYPEHEAYTLYQRPSFKVRVGNFRNKLEAQKLYHKLNQYFQTVFIVPTRIEYPALPQIN
jgi:hypothetical protein